MRIAVTADIHLTGKKVHPERYKAFHSLLAACRDLKIDHLVVAGDLFHADCRNASEFEALCREGANKEMRLIVIPGNHDQGLDARRMAAENVTVYSEPAVHRFDLMSLPILFVPYSNEKSIGEVLASQSEELQPNSWVLIGHGDWIQTMQDKNPMEPGTYMPVTRLDIERFKPKTVILGHVHKSMDSGAIHIPGSPYPLDINETGRRRFLILDTETGKVESVDLATDVLFFQESFLVFPDEKAMDRLAVEIEDRIRSWNLTEGERTRARVRVKGMGMAVDKKRMLDVLKRGFSGISFYEDEEPDLSRVSQQDPDSDLAEIVRKVADEAASLKWPQNPDEPGMDEILIRALHVVYGE